MIELTRQESDDLINETNEEKDLKHEESSYPFFLMNTFHSK